MGDVDAPGPGKMRNISAGAADAHKPFLVIHFHSEIAQENSGVWGPEALPKSSSQSIAGITVGLDGSTILNEMFGRAYPWLRFFK